MLSTVQCMSNVSAESHVEQRVKGCVSKFGSRSFFSVLVAGNSRLMGCQFLSSLLGFGIRMIIAL